MRIVRRDQMGPRLLGVRLEDAEADPDILDDLDAELEHYMEVLLGRVPPPINQGVMTLMEVASAYYARGQELNMQILKMERDGMVRKGSKLNKFRTGQLRSFLELTKRAADLGSRRLTHEQMLYQQRHDDSGLSWTYEDHQEQDQRSGHGRDDLLEKPQGRDPRQLSFGSGG